MRIKGISSEGMQRLARSVRGLGLPEDKESSGESEGLKNMLNDVFLLKESVGGNYEDFGGTVEMGAPEVHVAIVHDGTGGPGAAAALYFSHSSPDEAVKEAYKHLETSEFEGLSDGERQEMWDIEEREGYNPVTEAYDGQVFSMSPEEFKQVIIETADSSNAKELSVIEFEFGSDFDDYE